MWQTTTTFAFLILVVDHVVGDTLQSKNNLRGLQEEPLSLEERWRIGDEPTFKYDSLNFTLNYSVSDFILNDESMVQIELYDRECLKADGSSYIVPTSVLQRSKGSLQSNGEGTSQVPIFIAIQPETISLDSAIYQEDVGSQVRAFVDFCIRFSLTAGNGAIEVNFLEMLVQLEVDLTDGFTIGDVSVLPNDRIIRTANQIYECEGYFCDSLNQPTEIDVMNQGDVVRVCVRPNAEAIADGIKMRDVPSFTFVRDEVITQNAIVNSRAAPNGLTSLDCERGYQVCSFDTILFANFYRSPGRVDGYGICNMQFGGQPGSVDSQSLSGSSTEQDQDLTLPFEPDPLVGDENDNCSSLGGSIETIGNQILLESTSVYAGKDATVLSKTAFAGTGPGDDVELTVKIVDRELLTAGYMPQLVLFFAPPATTIEDVSTTDNGFTYYFEPAVIAWMKAKIYCCMEYTYFYVKTRNDLNDMSVGQDNTPSKMETGHLRLRRSNGFVTAFYSLDDGNTWVQIADSYELPDEYKTGPLKVGYRVFREWKSSYSFLTEPTLVAGNEVTVSKPALPPSYFSALNAETSPGTVSFTDAHTMFSSTTAQGGLLLSTSTFADDVSLTVKILDRQAFGTAYQAGVYLYFVPASTTLDDLYVTDQTFDTFEDNALASFGDKLYPSICHTWTYSNSRTPNGLIRQFGGDNFGKNLDGYLKLERRGGVISTYISTNGIGWKEEGTQEVLPEAYRNVPIKVGIQIRKHWNPSYELKVLPTLETGVLEPVTSYGDSPFLHTTHIPLAGATASNFQDGDRSAGMAIDQDSTSYWNSGTITPSQEGQWLQADMASIFVVTSVTMDWKSEYAAEYTLEVSEDGSTWETVHTEQIENPAIVEDHFIEHFDISEPAVGRYIRVVCKALANGAQSYSIWGFHVHGYQAIPISLGGAAASSASGSYPARNGFDDNHSTRWSTEGGDGSQTHWIQADMGKDYVLTFVSIDWHDAYAQDYQVQVSPDGNTWSTVYEERGLDNPSHVDSHYVNKFPIHPPWQQRPAVGRYVRIRMSKFGVGGNNHYSVWEIHCHGYEDTVDRRILQEEQPGTDLLRTNKAMTTTPPQVHAANSAEVPSIQFFPQISLSAGREEQQKQQRRLQQQQNSSNNTRDRRQRRRRAQIEDEDAEVSSEFEMEFTAQPRYDLATSGADIKRVVAPCSCLLLGMLFLVLN